MLEGSKIDLWHQKLAHVNLRQLSQLVANLEGVDMQLEGELSFCEACVHARKNALPATFSNERYQVKENLQLVATN